MSMPGSDGTIISSVTSRGACASAAEDTADIAATARPINVFMGSSVCLVVIAPH